MDAFARRAVGGSVQPSGCRCGVGEMTAHIFADLLWISEGTQVKMFTRFLHDAIVSSPWICCTTRVVLTGGVVVDEGLGTFIINVNH